MVGQRSIRASRKDWTIFDVAPQPCAAGGRRQEASLGLLVPVGALAGATLYFGIFTEMGVGGASRSG